MTFSDRMDTLKTLHNRTIQIGCVNVIVVVNCWGTVSKRPRCISSRHELLPMVTIVHVVVDVAYFMQNALLRCTGECVFIL